MVLGSGGHTKEMLTMLRGLDASRYRPAVFVRADVRYGMGCMHAWARASIDFEKMHMDMAGDSYLT